MKKVILESPYAGNVNRNKEYARLCMKDSLSRGEAPIVSHLLYTQVLDDLIPKERQQGIDAGLAWRSVTDLHVFYIDYGMSDGMQYAFKQSNLEFEFRKILYMAKIKHCDIDPEVELKQKPNSSLYYPCFKCEARKRNEKNKALLAQSSFYKKKGTQKSLKSKLGKTRGKTPRQKAMDRADEIFSRYIRVLFSIESGGELFCKCIITGKLFHIKRVDNGHCFSRNFKPTRFEVDNCRPQNRQSNRFKGEADHYKFIDNLKKEIGEERFERINRLRTSLGEDNELFYLEQKDKFQKLFKELLKERNLLNPWR